MRYKDTYKNPKPNANIVNYLIIIILCRTKEAHPDLTAPKIGDLGSGSDYAAFINMAGQIINSLIWI